MQRNARRGPKTKKWPDSDLSSPPGQGLHMQKIRTAHEGGPRFFDESDAFDGERKRQSRDTETPNDLTRYRWQTPIPAPGELADLVRLAKADDQQAKRRLVECFHRLVLKLATRFYGPSIDDLIAAGMAGFWTAVRRYSVRRNTGLATFATDWILKAMRAEVAQARPGRRDAGRRCALQAAEPGDSRGTPIRTFGGRQVAERPDQVFARGWLTTGSAGRVLERPRALRPQ